MRRLRPDRRVSRDLLAVIAIVALADASLLLAPLDGAPRLVLGLAFALVAPGYAVVAALFPDGKYAGAPHLVLAVTTSAVLTPLCGLALSLTPLGFGAGPLAGVLTGLTCAAVALAARRRTTTDHTADTAPTSADRSWRTLDGALVVLTVLAVASVGHAALTPATGGTSLSLTTTDDAGERVAGNYPEGNGTITLGVTNHGTTATTYTVVVQRQRVAAGNASRVLARDEISRETITVEAGDTRTRPSTVTDRPGRTRVVYLLYEGEAPETPTIAGADYETHRWLD